MSEARERLLHSLDRWVANGGDRDVAERYLMDAMEPFVREVARGEIDEHWKRNVVPNPVLTDDDVTETTWGEEMRAASEAVAVMLHELFYLRRENRALLDRLCDMEEAKLPEGQRIEGWLPETWTGGNYIAVHTGEAPARRIRATLYVHQPESNAGETSPAASPTSTGAVASAPAEAGSPICECFALPPGKMCRHCFEQMLPEDHPAGRRPRTAESDTKGEPSNEELAELVDCARDLLVEKGVLFAGRLRQVSDRLRKEGNDG